MRDRGTRGEFENEGREGSEVLKELNNDEKGDETGQRVERKRRMG